MAVVLKVILFFLIAYAFSWVGYILNYLSPGSGFSSMNPLGPILAAPLTLWLTEGGAAVKAWWARIWRFKAPIWVYFCAIFVTAAIIASSTAMTMALSGDRPLPEELAQFPNALIAFPIITIVFGPFGEEPGFRGHGQFSLEQVMSPLTASLWIGLGVVIWHAPLFIAGELPYQLGVCIVAVSVVYAWLFRAGGSVWPLILLHGMINTFNGNYVKEWMTPEDNNIELYFLTGFFILWAVLIVWRNGASLGRAREQ